MLAFFELTPRFKKLKLRASLEFCIHLDMSQIGIGRFTKILFSDFVSMLRHLRHHHLLPLLLLLRIN